MNVLRPALILLVLMTVLTGLVYPLVVTGIGHTLFAHAAGGSLIEQGGQPVGSELIGQAFTSARYFWGRPSATTPMAYNGAGSNASNWAPTNPALTDAVKARVDALRTADPGNREPVPIDLVTASASGLDPDISPAAALYQVPRIARSRHMDPARVRELVLEHTQGPQWHLFGEPRVNVLLLNQALDRAQ
ncbi:MAG TPA: potassium-transporting ATPase subunit KdpC [Steroidobacteraceae bacterium]|nr:potassium-transporting ATPase subunit KdpC [Steroidobacteraceae bacterium]